MGPVTLDSPDLWRRMARASERPKTMASSDEARAFYERCGFRPSPVEPMTLMITIAEARRMLAKGRVE